jgi:hypothetical protein
MGLLGWRERAVANLKDVLEWICHFSPVVHKMFVPFAHDEVKVLIGIARYEDIMRDTLLVLGECSPAVTVQRLQQRKARPVQTRSRIE